MRTKKFIIGVAVGIGLAVVGGNGEANGKAFHAHFAGIDTYKDDFSFTGTSGVDYETVAGKSTLGEYTAQAVADVEPDGNACPLPGGGSGVELVEDQGLWVLSFTATGEQLFLHLRADVTNHICLDPGPFTVSGQITFDVSGGTGRFVGASGTIVKTFTFINLAQPSPPGRGGFASLTGTFDGTIELAK